MTEIEPEFIRQAIDLIKRHRATGEVRAKYSMQEGGQAGSPQHVPAPQWQPIETAPKDGTRVLLFFPGFVIPVWVGDWHEGWRPEYGVRTPPIEDDPTHWMPLPAPPGKEAA